MLNIASENGLSASSETLITDVQTYIKNAATYNLLFESIPADVDIAVYFLTVSKEGICQHYATAATVMYRALGIPARYATGFVGDAVANEWSVVTGKFAHAWVEIYIDGFGWMPIEVTGGGDAAGVGDGSGSGGGTGDGGEAEADLTITPRAVKEPYVEGLTIEATSARVNGFSTYSALGYTYDITFEGELSTPGIGVSRVATFIVYDELGQDITDQFNIIYNEGILQLYLYEIDLYTSSDNKIYDGTALTNDGWFVSGDLAPGHYISEVNVLGEQLSVGMSKNNATIIIFNEFDEDVTGLYNIVNYYGDLMVMPRTLTIESGSASKDFDGTALIDHTYVMTGSLAPTDSIDVVITGTQTAIGSSVNIIDSIIITNAGVDVTNNYIIEVIEGELTVNPSYS